jgi:SAM-dependent methyltransferase
MLTLLHCAGCGSAFYDPPGINNFSDLNQERDDFWRFYVEVGGGVWETIWPILVDVAPGKRTLLDVGCGFGFAVDFWRRTTGEEAVGVELADYGAIGARMLDILIYREFVQDCAALRGRRFDIVYASEVIEHVPDPFAFVALLAPFVTEEGVLILTTPSADYITRDNASPTLLSALAPGFHGFLLASRAFGDAARAAGFAHVVVRTFGERQVLWASRVPRRLEFAPHHGRETYFAYLEQWFHRNEPSSPLWQGYAYRYVRDLANLGRLKEARPRADTLLAALSTAFGPAIRDPAAMTSRLHEVETLTEFGRIAPFFLPCLYYTLGAIAQHHDRDAAAARRWYLGAAELGRDCARLGTMSFLEASSLVWPARAMDAGLALAAGEFASAAATFAALARHGRRCDASDGYALASPDYIETVVPRACEGFALARAWDAAREVFSAYRVYLESSYPGRDFISRAGVEAALEGRAPAVPKDPMFAFFFQGVLDAVAVPTLPDAGARLLALAELAAASRAHPTQGKRLEAYADIGRRYLPGARPTVLFDFAVKLQAPGTTKR